MQLYIEEALKFIESDEMRNCLRENANRLDGHDYAQIVLFAPVAIERKIAVLDLIAEHSGYTADYYNPAKLAQQARTALAERYNNPPGTIFELFPESSRGEYYPTPYFTDFDAAARYAKENAFSDEEDHLHIWHSIYKHIPGENGVMERLCSWELNNSCDEIWYFCYNNNPPGWDDFYSHCHDNLNLPVPFQPGDIILADCHPYVEVQYVLITEIDDDANGRVMQCMYCWHSRFRILDFKQNGFIINGVHTFSHLPVLYRATRWTGALPDDHERLRVIGEALKADPELRPKLREFIKSLFISWEEIQTALNL